MALTLQEYKDLKAQGMTPEQIAVKSTGKKGFEGFSVGVAKGLVNTTRNIGKLGQEFLQETAGRGIEAATGRDRDTLGSKFYEGQQPDILKPQNGAEKFGYVTEQIAEFLVPSSKIAKLSKGQNLATRALIEATSVGGQTAIQEGEIFSEDGTINDDVKTSFLVGLAFPIVGAGLKEGKKAVGRGLAKTGEKIQSTVIRPSRIDIKDGFDVANVSKYKLGGSLQETVTKSNIKLNSLSKELDDVLQASDSKVNLNKVYKATEKALLKGDRSKVRQFGKIGATERALKDLQQEILQVSDDGVVDIVEANLVKRGAGTKGAWAYGQVDRDAKALEQVYTNFYGHLRKEILKAAGNSSDDIARINKELSDIIPISNAAIRRLPVEQRNNVLSLTDSIGLYASAFDPNALMLVGANKLSKSGKFGNFLVKAGRKLSSEPASRSALGERAFGGNIRSLKGTQIGLSTKDISPQNIAKQVDAADVQIMTNFIDDVRLRGSNKDALKMGQELADIMQLPDNIRFGGNAKLANYFDDIIQYSRGADDVAIGAKKKLLESIKNSQAMNIDGAIKAGDIAKDKVYQAGGNKILTKDFATGRIDDIAQKLEQFRKGSGDAYRRMIDPNNVSMDDLVRIGQELVELISRIGRP